MNKQALGAAIALILLLCAVGVSLADDVRPAYLGIENSKPSRFTITWKNPLFNGVPLPIEPVFPEGFTRISPITTIKTPDSIIRKWVISSEGQFLEGQEIAIAGLPATTSDVLFRIKFHDGRIFRDIFKPNAPVLTILLPSVENDSEETTIRRSLRRIDSHRLFVLLVLVGILGASPAFRKRGVVFCSIALILGSSTGYLTGQLPVKSVLSFGTIPSEDKTNRILHGLLLNVYRSFSYGDDEAVYDQMAKSVSGELLTDVYLQNRNVMRIEGEGKAQTYVDRLDIREIDEIVPEDSGGFSIIASWDVYGSVNHWEHIHYRCNAYKAKLTLMPVGKYWKITGFDLLDENRIM